MLKGSCHCGAVGIEISRKPRVLRRCTCSICRRYGAVWAYCSAKTAQLSHAPDALTAYRWNDEVIEFWHCRTCGCLTHYTSNDTRAGQRIAINTRMLAPEDIEGIRVRTFDGADTWRYLD